MTLELGGQRPRLLVAVQLAREQDVFEQQIRQFAACVRAIAVENQRRLVRPFGALERSVCFGNEDLRVLPQLLPPRRSSASNASNDRRRSSRTSAALARPDWAASAASCR